MGFNKVELQPKDRLPASLINSMQDTILANETSIAGLLNRNAKIQHGSYTGTGVYGKSSKNILTFDFAPKFVFVQKNSDGHCIGLFLIYGNNNTGSFIGGNNFGDITASWDDKSVSWYSTSSTLQLNASNDTYYYIAIG